VWSEQTPTSLETGSPVSNRDQTGEEMTPEKTGILTLDVIVVCTVAKNSNGRLRKARQGEKEKIEWKGMKVERNV